MPKIIMLIPTIKNIGLRNVSISIMHAMKEQKIVSKIFQPIYQLRVDQNMIDIVLFDNINDHVTNNSFEKIHIKDIQKFLNEEMQDSLIDKIVDKFYQHIKDTEIVLLEGIVPIDKYKFINSLNYKISQTLNAETIFVLPLENKVNQSQLKEEIELSYFNFGGKKNKNIIGVIINEFYISITSNNNYRNNCFFSKKINSVLERKKTTTDIDLFFLKKKFPSICILGYIPWNFDFVSIPVVNIVNYLNANIINEGDLNQRYIKSITIYSCKLLKTLEHIHENSLLIISSNHLEILASVFLSVINGLKITAILLTDSFIFNKDILKSFKNIFLIKLPIFYVKKHIWEIMVDLQNFIFSISLFDNYRNLQKITNKISYYIDKNWIKSYIKNSSYPNIQTPPVLFRHKLIKLAQNANKTIVLPEGKDPRIIKAAMICSEKSIANCILLGNPKDIYQTAKIHNIKFNKNTKIFDPKIVSQDYVPFLCSLRKDKGMTEKIAIELVKNEIILGILMLARNEVDGLVSGVINTTANTIRPSLQLIKTAPGNSIVSSIFFMLFPEKVLIYGDCAINKNPTSEQLAEIAIQSANSAFIFGIDPYIAILSYATGTSSSGKDVEKVYEAVRLVKKLRPDLLIDGPLQYDAAIISDVSTLKAPHSSVAGKATILIFPDLNSGNIVYKAVQRTGNLIAIGPILQGLKKPVNDLSRGALVEDIVYNVAITAIQSK